MNRALTRFALAATTTLSVITPALAQDAAPGSSSDIIVTARRTEERLQDVPISITVFNQQQIANANIVDGTDLARITPSLQANSRFGTETAMFAIRGFTQENFTSPSVGTYFADVIGPRANGGTPGGNGAGVGQLFDLQNVQVLKGPQGTLFGRNTTGGAVLIVPKRPTDELGGYIEGQYGNYDMYRLQGVLNVPLADTFKVRVGFDRMKRDGYLKNRSGIGPKRMGDTDYWAFRASVLAELTPDLENYTIGRYSESNTRGLYGRTIAANADGCRDGVDPAAYPYPVSPDAGALVPGATRPTTGATTASFLAPLACAGTLARAEANNYGFWDVENGNPDPFLKIKQWGLINTTTWNASDTITLKNIASYQQFSQSQSLYIGNDNYVTPESWGQFAGLPFTWVGLNPAQSLHNVEQETFTEEFQIQGRSSDGRLDYVVGGYYEKANPLSPFQGSYSPISYVTTLTSAQDPRIPAGVGLPVLVALNCADVATLQCTSINSTGQPGFPGMIQNSLTRYWYENIGFFAQGTYDITEQFAVTGGIRYTIDKTRAEGATRQLWFLAPNTPYPICAYESLEDEPFPTPKTSAEQCVRSSKQKSEKPTWLINLDYRPADDILLYGKYARGYRQGNINASNTVPQGWGPEKVDSYEIGAKFSFRGQLSGYFNAAAFYNDFSDQQLAASLIPAQGSTASPAQAIVNAGKSRITGLEVDSMVNYSLFSLAVGYTYLDTKLKSYTPVDFEGYDPAMPNSDVGGPLPLSPKHKVTVTPSVRIPVDENLGRITLSGTYLYTSSQITSAASVTPYGTVPSYEIVNLNLNWDAVGGSPVDFALFATNLFNEKYYTFIGGGWQSTGVEYGTVGQPRMYGARLRFRFGGEAN